MSLQQVESLPDDPRAIAALLVKEKGLIDARQVAVDGTTTANQDGNFYRLSIWREVKGILAGWIETPESET